MPYAELGGTKQTSFISVPGRYDYRSFKRDNFPNISHARIPELVKLEYLEKVTNFFESIPRIHSIKKQLDISRQLTVRNRQDMESRVQPALEGKQGCESLSDVAVTIQTAVTESQHLVIYAMSWEVTYWFL